MRGRTFVIHEDYKEEGRKNDIAVVFTARKFDFAADKIKAIALPTEAADLERNTAAVVAGFGFTAARQNAPNQHLLAADVAVVARRVCETTFGTELPTHICARDRQAENPANVCPGDNGNGLFIEADEEEANDNGGNTGNENTGKENTGNENTGNENTGNENTGNENTGNENNGNENTGNENTGNENTGNENESEQPPPPKKPKKATLVSK